MIREMTMDEALEVVGGEPWDPYSWSPTPQSPTSLLSLNTSLNPIGLGPVYGGSYYPPTNSSPPFSVSGSFQGGVGLQGGVSVSAGPSTSSTGQTCFNISASLTVVAGIGFSTGATASWCNK